MRKKNSSGGKLLAVLAVLAAVWLAAGTFGIFQLKDYRDRLVRPQAEEPEEQVEEEAAEPEEEPYEAEEPEEEEPAEEPEEEEEPEEPEEEEKKKDYVVMIVSAPDNYAAVRTGRGTQFEEVGRITNGHRVALKDLENGWYKIARGKYKGYYTHQSSFIPE